MIGLSNVTSTQIDCGSRGGATDPEFLKRRVAHYYDVRLATECAGIHPMKGRVAGPGSIQLRSNDYLCLADHPHIVNSEINTLYRGGHGASISRSFLHHYKDALATFEERLAKLMRAEAAVLCNSGYGANVGAVQAIVGPDIPVYIDMKAHISLWEGIKSGDAKPLAFRHNDIDHLTKLVERIGSGVIIVDAIYSIDGNICPLKELVELAERTGSVLVVDETHSLGTIGDDGGGLAVKEGLAERIHFRTCGLSKAVASRGGAILCSARNAEFLRYESIQAIFSTSVLNHEVAGYNAALDIFASEPWRRQRLHANHQRLWAGLDALGYNIDSSRAQIIALDGGDIQQTTRLRDALEQRDVFGAIFMPPATPAKRCILRFTVNCGLSEQEIDKVIEVCADIRDELGVANWASTRRKGRRPTWGQAVASTAA